MSVIDRSGRPLENRVVIAFTARVTVAVIGLFSAFLLARLLGRPRKDSYGGADPAHDDLRPRPAGPDVGAVVLCGPRPGRAASTRRAVMLAAVLSAIGIGSPFFLPFIEEHIFKNIDPVVLLGSLAIVPSLFAFAFMNSISTGRQQMVAYGLLAIVRSSPP
jgi:hypothetical protein